MYTGRTLSKMIRTYYLGFAFVRAGILVRVFDQFPGGGGDINI